MATSDLTYSTQLAIHDESRIVLLRKIEGLLELMELEYKHANTHSQRNAYQAVIRHEIEWIADLVRYASKAELPARSDNEEIPF